MEHDEAPDVSAQQATDEKEVGAGQFKGIVSNVTLIRVPCLLQTPGQQSQMFHPCGNDIERNYISPIAESRRESLVLSTSGFPDDGNQRCATLDLRRRSKQTRPPAQTLSYVRQ